MSLEIERKFLIKKIPNEITKNILSNIYPYLIITQSYVEKNETAILRVRSQKSFSPSFDEIIYSGYITVKSNSLIEGAVNEYEMTIPYEAAESFHKLQNSINKTRYLINNDANIIELDIFADKLSGLVIAEIEFETIEESRNFIPLPWFDKEVTTDKKYSNASLINGLP